MTDIDVETQPQTAAQDDTMPAAPKRFSRLRRRDRKGLGTGELVALILVIALVGIIAGLGISRLVSARSGVERSALQSNMDSVAQIVDNYWLNHAADAAGRRKLAFPNVCSYVNAQLTGGDIVLRTLQYVDTSGNTQTAITAGTPPVPNTANPAVAEVFRTVDRGEEFHASCPDPDDTSGSAPNIVVDSLINSYGDILVAPTGTTGAITVDPADVLRAPGTNAVTTANSGAGAHGGTAGIVAGTAAGTRIEAMQAAGLESTKTVWIAMYGTPGTAAINGFDAGDPAAIPPTNLLPPGTDGKFTRGLDNWDTGGTEYIVIGGVAVDGSSYCMIKVLDAAAAGDTGNWYRSAADTDDNTFLTCLDGVAGAARDGWPEPQ